MNSINWDSPFSQFLPVHCGLHEHVWLLKHTPLIHCGLHNAVCVCVWMVAPSVCGIHVWRPLPKFTNYFSDPVPNNYRCLIFFGKVVERLSYTWSWLSHALHDMNHSQFYCTKLVRGIWTLTSFTVASSIFTWTTAVTRRQATTTI